MNLHTIYKYASNRTMHRLLVYVAGVFLCCAMFALLLISFFAWSYIRRERTACERCLNGGIKQAGMILFDTYTEEFLQDIMNMEEIVGLTDGDIYMADENMIPELGQQQKKMDSEYVEENRAVPWFYMNPEGVDVCHMNLKEGKRPDEWQIGDRDYLIYLGGNFENIEVGTKYYVEQYDETYIVGGILEKGTDWIYHDVYFFKSILDTRYVQNLDSMVVVLEKEGVLMSFRNTYIVKEGYQLEDVEQKLQNLAQKHGVDIKLARLEDVMDENEYQYSYILNAIRTMTLVIIITVLVLLERTQFSEMIGDTEYFGIFYANGASTKDLIAILVGENLLKIALSFLLAVVGGYFVVKFSWQMFQPGIDNWRNASSIYFGQAVLPSFLVGLLIVGLATLRPIKWLKEKSPVELIQGYKA